jgi:hypothetical protein
MEIAKSEIWNDSLIRYVPIEGNFLEGEVVITKEEFLACYNIWVKEADGETN